MTKLSGAAIVLSTLAVLSIASSSSSAAVVSPSRPIRRLRSDNGGGYRSAAGTVARGNAAAVKTTVGR
jgi:hypothetical protein